MRVLIIEDDEVTARSLETFLKSEGMICDTSHLGQDGLEIAKHYDYDLIILDKLLPDINGYDLLKRLRSLKIQTPVLILSGVQDREEKVKGLDIGADDYITKPFHWEELSARIKAIVRRSKGHAQSEIQIGRLKINLNTQTVLAGELPLRLTSREYSILELMAIRQGSILSKEIFLNHLYGGLEEPDFKIIDVFICKLRKKISALLEGANYIETIWGRGYMLKVPPVEAEANV